MKQETGRNPIQRALSYLGKGGCDLDERSAAPYVAIGRGMDNVIKSEYLLPATLLTALVVTGVACDRNSNPTKIPDSNTPIAGQVVPENRTVEKAARAEEIKKVRDMLEGHNLTPALKSSMDSFWTALPGLPLSEYKSMIQENSSSGQTTYAINYHNYDNSSNITMFLLNSSPKGNSTIERLDILTYDVPTADISAFALMKDLNTSFGDMKQTSGHEWSSPDPDFPDSLISVYNAGHVVNETAPMPGTFRIAAHIINTDKTEVLTHVYVKANPNTPSKFEAPVKVVNPLFAKLDQAVGEDWMDFSYTVGHDLNNRLYSGIYSGGEFSGVAQNLLSPENKDFYQRAYYSMGLDPHAGFSLSPAGFIDNVAVDYAKGKDYFMGMYGKILTPVQVNNLYNFVKEDIFKGKEY